MKSRCSSKDVAKPREVKSATLPKLVTNSQINGISDICSKRLLVYLQMHRKEIKLPNDRWSVVLQAGVYIAFPKLLNDERLVLTVSFDKNMKMTIYDGKNFVDTSEYGCPRCVKDIENILENVEGKFKL